MAASSFLLQCMIADAIIENRDMPLIMVKRPTENAELADVYVYIIQRISFI